MATTNAKCHCCEEPIRRERICRCVFCEYVWSARPLKYFTYRIKMTFLATFFVFTVRSPDCLVVLLNKNISRGPVSSSSRKALVNVPPHTQFMMLLKADTQITPWTSYRRALLISATLKDRRREDLEGDQDGKKDISLSLSLLHLLEEQRGSAWRRGAGGGGGTPPLGELSLWFSSPRQRVCRPTILCFVQWGWGWECACVCVCGSWCAAPLQTCIKQTHTEAWCYAYKQRNTMVTQRQI